MGLFGKKKKVKVKLEYPYDKICPCRPYSTSCSGDACRWWDEKNAQCWILTIGDGEINLNERLKVGGMKIEVDEWKSR